MPAATNSVRKVSRGSPKSPTMTPPPLSIAPRGNRSTMPTVSRAPRMRAMNTRDYGKAPLSEAEGFAMPGFQEGR